MEAAEHAALDERPEAIDVAGMDLSAHVLSGAVTDSVMRRAEPSEAAVSCMLVGRHNVNVVRNRLVDEAFQPARVGRLDHLADHASLAGNGADNSDLAGRSATALPALGTDTNAPAVPVLGLAPDVGLVDLDNARELLERRVEHRGPNAVAHAERLGKTRASTLGLWGTSRTKVQPAELTLDEAPGRRRSLMAPLR